MLATGQLVMTPSGESGTIVSLAGARFVSLEENDLRIRAVLIADGEVRSFAEAALRPMTRTYSDPAVPRQVARPQEAARGTDELAEDRSQPPLRRRRFRQ